MSTHEPNNPSVVDPVCGMTIDRASAAGRSTYQGATVSFCSTACKTCFDANPAAYVGAVVGRTSGATGGGTPEGGDGTHSA